MGFDWLFVFRSVISVGWSTCSAPAATASATTIIEIVSVQVPPHHQDRLVLSTRFSFTSLALAYLHFFNATMCFNIGMVFIHWLLHQHVVTTTMFIQCELMKNKPRDAQAWVSTFLGCTVVLGSWGHKLFTIRFMSKWWRAQSIGVAFNKSI